MILGDAFLMGSDCISGSGDTHTLSAEHRNGWVRPLDKSLLRQEHLTTGPDALR